jgi:hypothetical protein
VAWLALSVLLGVGHVVPAFHFLFVAHRLCAEHGELVDATSEGTEGPRAQSPEFSSSSRLPATIRSGHGVGHTHEHCGVLALARSLGAPLAPRGFAGVLPAACATSVPGEARAAHVEIALLLYAPKLEPPSGASLFGTLPRALT